jgi:hypothetical protein
MSFYMSDETELSDDEYDIDSVDELAFEFNEAANSDEIAGDPEIWKGRAGLLMRLFELECATKMQCMWLVGYMFKARIHPPPATEDNGLVTVSVDTHITKQDDVIADTKFTVWEDVECLDSGIRQRIYRTSFDADIIVANNPDCDVSKFLLEKFSLHCTHALPIEDRALYVQRGMIYEAYLSRDNPSHKPH